MMKIISENNNMNHRDRKRKNFEKNWRKNKKYYTGETLKIVVFKEYETNLYIHVLYICHGKHVHSVSHTARSIQRLPDYYLYCKSWKTNINHIRKNSNKEHLYKSMEELERGDGV